MGRRPSILLYCLFMLLLVGWSQLPNSWETHRAFSSNDYTTHDTITILSPVVMYTSFYGLAGGAVLLFVMGIVSFRRHWLRYPVFALLLAICAFPMAVLFHAVINLDSWTTHGRITTDDGATYVFCDSSFLQGQLMALTHVESESWWGSRYKVLGTTNGDSPRSWASVIRPAGAENHYGQLYLTGDHRLVGLRGGNHCYLVYDLAANKSWNHDEVKTTSPFICLAADDELHEADVETMRKTIGERQPGQSGYPVRRTLVTAAAEQENRRAREVAAELLELVDGAAKQGAASDM